jgi:hypothetical protein
LRDGPRQRQVAAANKVLVAHHVVVYISIGKGVRTFLSTHKPGISRQAAGSPCNRGVGIRPASRWTMHAVIARKDVIDVTNQGVRLAFAAPAACCAQPCQNLACLMC